jgi:predicted component of type VI protein secretion system
LVVTLHVREAGGEPRVVHLEDEPVTIGRDPNSTIQINSPYVSRHHARIERQEGVTTLVDLGSRNGSLLNGVRVSGSTALQPGDVIAIGDATIECVDASPDSEATRTLVLTPGQPGMPGVPASPAATPVAPDTLHVDPQTYEVTIDGEPHQRRLSAQEFQLLSYLYEHRDRVCTRRELGDAIWGRDRWDPNMLHRLVHRLKEKLEPDAERSRYIQTVPWVGYRCTP